MAIIVTWYAYIDRITDGLFATSPSVYGIYGQKMIYIWTFGVSYIALPDGKSWNLEKSYY